MKTLNQDQIQRMVGGGAGGNNGSGGGGNSGSGGGGGGGLVLTEPLNSINMAQLGAPTQANVGIIWDGTAWVYSSANLPTLYWANVEVSTTSKDNTEPKMKSLWLYGSSNLGVGGVLKFGDGTGYGYVYIAEESDDELTIYGKSGIYLMTDGQHNVGIGTKTPSHVLDVVGDINATLDITTAQAVNAKKIELSDATPFIDFHHASASADYTSQFITTDFGVVALKGKSSLGVDKLSGFVVGSTIDGSYVQIGNIQIVYDETNNALKIIKSDGTAANFNVTGSITPSPSS